MVDIAASETRPFLYTFGLADSPTLKLRL